MYRGLILPRRGYVDASIRVDEHVKGAWLLEQRQKVAAAVI